MLRIESLDSEEELGDERDDLASDDAEQNLRRRAAEAIYGSDEELKDLRCEGGWDDLFQQANNYTITKLTPAVKDLNRVNVFLDGHFAFSLDISQVVGLNVKVNQNVDAERLKVLQAASEFGKLYQRTLEWVLTRPHSIRETTDYLKRRKIKRRQLNRQREREEKRPLPELNDETMALVVEKLIEKGYLDDQKFAKFFVENRFVRKGISQKRLKMELKQKGVKDELIKVALQTIPRPEDEEIQKMIRKKRAKYNDFQMVGYLVRQGFDFQKAKNAVENYRTEDEIE